MDQKIAALTDHIIVCGAGSTGRHIIEELRKAGSSFVVIERGAGNLERLKEDPLILFVEGDATRDETLLAAGIERAAGLITALARDEDNLFVTISGRQLNPKLRIVARGVEDGVGGELRKAGADSVVFPNHIGGLRLAYEMVRPGVVSFLDTMLRKSDGTVQFTELVVPEGASCADQRLQDTPISRQGALPILALRRPGETHFVYNPSPETPLTSGMVLIVMGEVGQAAKMKELLA